MACNLGDNKVKKEGKKKSKHTDTDMKRRKKKPLPWLTNGADANKYSLWCDIIVRCNTTSSYKKILSMIEYNSLKAMKIFLT